MLITSHYVDIDTPGKQNDANVLKNSIYHRAIIREKRI